MAEKEIEALKETLQTQQKLIHKLYVELEAEREASSTSANEALSMILRLQGEKAAEKLEAIQFKRMTQEKMNHAEQIMDVFEDCMHQKQLEIASLQFQLRAYHYKMLSLGLTDSPIPEMNLEDSLFTQEHKLRDHGFLTRIQSLPAIRLKDSTLNKSSICKDTPHIALEELSPSLTNQDRDLDFEVCPKDVLMTSEESAATDLTSCWEKIKELDERVNDLTCGQVIDERIEYDRISSNKEIRSAGCAITEESQVGLRSSFSSEVTRGVMKNELDYQSTFSGANYQAKYAEDLLQSNHSNIPCLEIESTGSASQSMSIHDVFEVPQNNDHTMLCPPQKQEEKNLAWEEENWLRKPDQTPRGTIKYCCKDEAGYLKSTLQCANDENQWIKPREGDSVSCHLALVDLTKGIFPFQPDFQQINKRLEKLEGETRIVNQGGSNHKEEKLRLLKEIHDQLRKIETEIRSEKIKSPAADEPSLVSLMEAMFFYSL